MAKTEYVEVVKYAGAPDELLRDCNRPGMKNIKTNGDMVKRLQAYDHAVETCNLDKKALRDLQPSGSAKP